MAGEQVTADIGTHTALDSIALTKSDATTYAQAFRALYVGGTGDVTLKHNAYGNNVTYKAVPAGTILPVQCYQLRATGTTATDVVGLL